MENFGLLWSYGGGASAIRHSTDATYRVNGVSRFPAPSTSSIHTVRRIGLRWNPLHAQGCETGRFRASERVSSQKIEVDGKLD